MWLRPLQPPQGEWPLPFEPHRRDDPSRTHGQGLSAPGTPEQGVTLSLHPPAKGTALRPQFPLHPFLAVSGGIRNPFCRLIVCLIKRSNEQSNKCSND